MDLLFLTLVISVVANPGIWLVAKLFLEDLVANTQAEK